MRVLEHMTANCFRRSLDSQDSGAPLSLKNSLFSVTVLGFQLSNFEVLPKTIRTNSYHV